MLGLVLQVQVMCRAATYVRMHLVRIFIVLPLFFWFFFFAYVLNRLFNVVVAFFYCETDGSSLCLQCDMIVHVGGKRTHGRYLLFRQRVEVCLSFIQIELVLYLLDSYRFLRKTNVSILVVMFVFFSFTGIWTLIS
jgi:hypothetical protein